MMWAWVAFRPPRRNVDVLTPAATECHLCGVGALAAVTADERVIITEPDIPVPPDFVSPNLFSNT